VVLFEKNLSSKWLAEQLGKIKQPFRDGVQMMYSRH